MTAKFPPVALPDSPYARELQQHCLSLPGAYEDYPWGEVVFKVNGKLFAMLGGSAPLTITVKATHENAAVLVGLPPVEPARYVGRHGWVTVRVEDEAALDLANDLVLASYALVAPKRRVRK